MAIEYQFSISTRKTPDELLASITSPFGDNIVGGCIAETLVKREILREAIGVDPNVQIYFQIANLGDRTIAMQTMVAACMAILTQESGDAVWLFNSERPLLVRTNGKITLNTNSGFWNESRLASLPFQYSLAEIPLV